MGFAALCSAVATLVVAVRTGQKVSATHDLVNGASAEINNLRESRGFRAGLDAASSAPRSREPGQS